jgi:hypothetical protein
VNPRTGWYQGAACLGALTAAWVRTQGRQSLDDDIVLANMGAETAAATEAVAKANDVTIS